jgi:hypothetical protein
MGLSNRLFPYTRCLLFTRARHTFSNKEYCLFTGRGNSAKVDPSRITQRGVILQKYLDHQAEFELQALYALQALVHKLEHPPG